MLVHLFAVIVPTHFCLCSVYEQKKRKKCFSASAFFIIQCTWTFFVCMTAVHLFTIFLYRSGYFDLIVIHVHTGSWVILTNSQKTWLYQLNIRGFKSRGIADLFYSDQTTIYNFRSFLKERIRIASQVSCGSSFSQKFSWSWFLQKLQPKRRGPKQRST